MNRRRLARSKRITVLVVTVVAASLATPAAMATAGGPSSSHGKKHAPGKGAACASSARADGRYVTGHVLSVNDFHGHLDPGKSFTYTDSATGHKAEAGGAAVLAQDLEGERAADGPCNTLLVDAGDMWGASPAESALLNDKPTPQVLNKIGFDAGTVGNHEIDGGVQHLLQMTGSEDFPTVAANVRYKSNHRLVFKPFVVKYVGGVPIAIIGADTVQAPLTSVPGAADDLDFGDPSKPTPEADAINSFIPQIHALGIHAIVALIHEGGTQDAAGNVSGRIDAITRALNPDVDVVVSGHTHTVINTHIAGKLVVQAASFGEAFADSTFVLDRLTRDIVSTSAVVKPVWTFDPYNSTTPAAFDPRVQAIVDQANTDVAPQVNAHVTTTARELDSGRTDPNYLGKESPLGDLIADAQRAAMGTQFAFMQPGGIRAALPAGEVTWGDCFNIHPFGNILRKEELTGAQVWQLLSQQFQPSANSIKILEISGLHYRYHTTGTYTGVIDGIFAGPYGDDSHPVPNDASATYTVTVNDFTGGGGDGFSVLTQGTNVVSGPLLNEALVSYLKTLPTPVDQQTENRSVRTG